MTTTFVIQPVSPHELIIKECRRASLRLRDWSVLVGRVNPAGEFVGYRCWYQQYVGVAVCSTPGPAAVC